MDLFNYFRRETTEVNIGAVPLGGPNSIRVQSMTNTSTQDTQACVEQAKRIVEDRKSTRLNSSHKVQSRMSSSA